MGLKQRICTLEGCDEPIPSDDLRKNYCCDAHQHKAMVARSNARQRLRTVKLNQQCLDMIEEMPGDKTQLTIKGIRLLHRLWKDGKVKL